MPINEISGLDDNSVQFPEKQPNNFQSDYTILHFYQQYMSDSIFPHTYQHVILSLFFILGILMYLIIVLMFISLMAKHAEHLLYIYLPSVYPTHDYNLVQVTIICHWIQFLLNWSHISVSCYLKSITLLPVMAE